MNFIEKENFALLECCENGGEIALTFEHWAGAGLDRDRQLVADHLREIGLAEAGRPVEQNMVERLATRACGLDKNGEILFYARLADVVREALRADADFDPRVLVIGLAGGDALRRLIHPRSWLHRVHKCSSTPPVLAH